MSTSAFGATTSDSTTAHKTRLDIAEAVLMQSTSAPLVEGDGIGGRIKLSSEEVNILIYLYLLESNFTHTAFTLLSESALPSSSLFQSFNPSFPSNVSTSNLRNPVPTRQGTAPRSASTSDIFGTSNGKIARGELVRKLWKALRWEEIERHSSNIPLSSCKSAFHLLVPHICSESEPEELSDARTTPPLRRPEVFPPLGPQPPLVAKRSGGNLHDAERFLHQDQSAHSSAVPAKSKRPGSSEPAGLTKASRRDDSATERGNGKQHEDLAGTPTHFEDAPASKKARDEDWKGSEGPSRSKSTSARSRGYAVRPSAPKPSNSFPTSDSGGASWSEHRDAVTCIAWNPKDKDVLVTGSADGTARLWDFLESPGTHVGALQLSKKPLSISHKSIDSGKKAVTALVWHPDGTVFATASDGIGRLFTPSGQLQGILTYGRGAINSLKFNPSGTSLLAAKDDFTVCLFLLDFDLQSPKQLSFESHTKEVNDVDWLDDDVFASGGNDHTIFICRSNDRRPRYTLKGHTDDVTRLKWSPIPASGPKEKRLLASASDDGTVMVWDMPHYPADRGTVSRSLSPSKQPREKDHTEENIQFMITPGSEYCIHRLSVVNGGTENKRMNTLEWSPISREGEMILAAGGQDSTVKLFNAVTGECLHVLSGLESGIGSIAFSPVGLRRPLGVVAGGGWNGKLVLWDVETGQVLQEHEIDEEPERQSARDKPMMAAMAWRNDGHQLALGLHNKTLLTLNVQTLL